MELLCIILELFCTSKNDPIAHVSRICTRSQQMLLALPCFPGHCVGVVGFEMTSETQSQDVL